MSMRGRWEQLKDEWLSLSYYQRFESLMAHTLTGVIGLIALMALGHLILDVISQIFFTLQNPLEDKVFQKIFGEIMTLLIALEFNHTLQLVVLREQSLIQTRIVILIAILALSRKFIVLNLSEITADYLWALAAITISLGAVYWLIQRKD